MDGGYKKRIFRNKTEFFLVNDNEYANANQTKTGSNISLSKSKVGVLFIRVSMLVLVLFTITSLVMFIRIYVMYTNDTLPSSSFQEYNLRPVYVFVHIPKAGGTSFIRILDKWCANKKYVMLM